jgi:hypothetical protein
MDGCGQSGKNQADEELDGRAGRGKIGGRGRAGRFGLARGANVGGKFGSEGASECLCTVRTPQLNSKRHFASASSGHSFRCPFSRSQIIVPKMLRVFGLCMWYGVGIGVPILANAEDNKLQFIRGWTVDIASETPLPPFTMLKDYDKPAPRLALGVVLPVDFEVALYFLRYRLTTTK